MKFNPETEIFDSRLLRLATLAKTQVPPQTSLAQLLLSLLMAGTQEEKASADVKAKRFALMCKIDDSVNESRLVDLTVDDLSVLNPLIDANCPTLIHGRLKEILNAPIEDAKA